MKNFIFIILTTFIVANVTNNGTEVTIPDNVSVTISGDLTLNSGDFVVDGSLLVSGNIFYNGGIIMGQGLLNNSQLTLGDLTQDGNIDIQDVVALVFNILNDGGYDPNGDIIQNGSLDIVDIVNLVQLILNQ